MATATARVRSRGANTVGLETGGVDGDTAATCGRVTLSLTYGTSVAAVPQSASRDIADVAGSIRLWWQCVGGVD